MKTWNETHEVLEAARACLNAGQACAIVVLTRVKGSAFRRPGAKLLIRADGSMTGNVSGGCLENDLRERAMKCIATNRQETVHYNTGSDEDVIWGLGLGCDGELDLLLVPISNNSGWIGKTVLRLKKFEPFSLAWDLENGPAGEPVLCTLEASAPPETFLDTLEPPPDLVIVGAGDDAIPMADLAATSGFRVTVVDHRAGYLSKDRFPRATEIHQLRPDSAAGIIPAHPRTMVVIKNHALEMDKRWAVFFNVTSVHYIGILGPKKRCAQIRELMTGDKTARIFGPAGLDLGAEGAEQIAVSIVSEMLAVWAARDAGHLREREAPIHSR